MHHPSPAVGTQQAATRKTRKASAARRKPSAREIAELPSKLEAERVGRFVRRSADRIAAEIAEAKSGLTDMLLALDGEEQWGLHDIRSAAINLDFAIQRLSTAIGKTKVRGEQGFTED